MTDVITTTTTSASTSTGTKSAADLTRELRDLITGQLVPLRDDELADDAALVDGVLDSLGIAEVAVFIEDEIGRALEPAEETRSTFASVDAVVAFVLAHR